MQLSKKKKDQQYYVVKSNDLIRHSRYNLTTQQQKLVLYAISKIKPFDTPDTWYEITVKDICAACGIDISDTGTYYKRIKDDLLKLTERQWQLLPDKSEVTVAWIDKARIDPGDGTVHIRFDEVMAPYLFDLKTRYTQYQLEDVLVFRGKYAIRLYEILRSYTTEKALEENVEKNVMMSLEELKDMLAVDGYERWVDFNRYVLKPAVNEINKCSDKVNIAYETYRKGKTISKINFIITPAKALQILNARQAKRERL